MINKRVCRRERWLIVFYFIFYTTGIHAEPDGEKLYRLNCMACHAYDGSGTLPGVLDLRKNTAWATIDKAKLLTRLKQEIQTPGATLTMPAKGGNPNLTDDDLKAIINYMHQSFLQ